MVVVCARVVLGGGCLSAARRWCVEWMQRVAEVERLSCSGNAGGCTAPYLAVAFAAGAGLAGVTFPPSLSHAAFEATTLQVCCAIPSSFLVVADVLL